MKKAIVVLLTVVMMLSTSCGKTVNDRPGNLQNGLSVDSPAEKDEKVTVKISFQFNPGIASAILKVNYDVEHLTLVDVKYINGFEGGGEPPEKKNVPVRLTWCDLRNNTETDFAELTFKVAKEFGSITECKINVAYSNGDICNLDEKDVPLTVLCESVFVK